MKGVNMQLRLFFPLWSMSTLIGEVSSAYRQEINKLRKWGIDYLLPYLANKKYKSYPFKIIVKFYVFSDIEITSLLLLSAYIVNCLGHYTFQSADYRVIPQVITTSKRVKNKDSEGCEIIIERHY